jgi:hypothetical protein
VKSSAPHVYSIIFTLESKQFLQLVVPLDSNGNSLNGRCRAAERGKRVVDVWPGQAIRFRRRKFVVTAVEAYRWAKDGVCYGWP